MPLTPAEHDLLGRFRRALELRLGERLVGTLFGSRARGEGTEQSDLDVLVLVSKLTKLDRRAIVDLAYDLELEAHLILSPLVRDSAAWPPPTLLATEIERDGVVL